MTRTYGYAGNEAMAQYRAAILSAGKLSYPDADGALVAGILTQEITAQMVTDGDMVNLQREGQALAQAGGAFSAGDRLRAAVTTGKLVKAAATATLDSTNALSDLTFTAKPKYQGPEGDEISVVLADPGTANQPLAVSVLGKKITVSLKTGADTGPIESTAAQVKAAVDALPAAADLVSVTAEGAGSGVVEAIPETFLSGGMGAFCTALEAAAQDGDIVHVDLGGVS